MAKLPDDFPGAEALMAAGFTTTHKVETAADDDLLSIPGIGPATLEKIRAVKAKPEEAGKTEAAPAVITSPPEPFSCASSSCGHSITSYPCPYCGFNG